LNELLPDRVVKPDLHAALARGFRALRGAGHRHFFDGVETGD
jgi:hypothetical protein